MKEKSEGEVMTHIWHSGKTEDCNRSQVANDSRLLICPERFPGSNPGGCASPSFFSGDKIPWCEQKDETPHFPGNTGGYIYKL